MTKQQSRRGRPRGSSRYGSDDDLLAEMRTIIASTGVSVNEAARRVAELMNLAADETTRLQNRLRINYSRHRRDGTGIFAVPDALIVSPPAPSAPLPPSDVVSRARSAKVSIEMLRSEQGRLTLKAIEEYKKSRR